MKLNSSHLILIGIIVGGTLGYGVTTWYYAPKYRELQTEYQIKETQFETLSQEYSTLTSDHEHLTYYADTLFDNYTTVAENYQTLFSNYNIIAEDYIILEIEKNNATAQYEELSSEYGDLEADYSELQHQYEECVTEVSQFEESPDIKFLYDQEYYHSLKADLVNAELSIIVDMYSMIYDPDDSFDWANELIEELVNAHDRGVNVIVYLEYRTFFGYQDDNIEAYDFLSANGVDVRLDYDDDTDHHKTVTIDYYIMYIGSHNWSESGLYYNNEASVKITFEN